MLKVGNLTYRSTGYTTVYNSYLELFYFESLINNRNTFSTYQKYHTLSDRHGHRKTHNSNSLRFK